MAQWKQFKSKIQTFEGGIVGLENTEPAYFKAFAKNCD